MGPDSNRATPALPRSERSLLTPFLDSAVWARWPCALVTRTPRSGWQFTRSNQATYLHPCRSSTFVTSSLKDFYAEAMPKNLPKLRNVAPTSIPDVKEHKEGSRVTGRPGMPVLSPIAKRGVVADGAAAPTSQRSTSTAGSGRIKLNDFRTWGQEIGKDAKRMHFP